MTKNNSNLVVLNEWKKRKNPESDVSTYQARIDSMSKGELMEEIVRFQEQRKRNGGLTEEAIINGMILFKAMESKAETTDLKIFSKVYQRHLSYELAHLRSGGKDNA